MTTNTSFGIELEFIALYPKRLFGATVSDRLQSRNPVLHAVLNEPRRLIPELRKALEANGIRVNAALRPGHENINYTRWTVGSDILRLSPEEVSLFPEDEWAQEPIELSSRVFEYRRGDWKAEVSAVLQTLDDLEREGIKFLVNQSTGFHVHVGDGTTTPIALRTAKNVLQFGTAFERLPDGIHTVPRIGGWEDDLAAHSDHFPLSLFFTRSEHVDPSHPPSLFKRLEKIEEATDYIYIGDFFMHYPGIPNPTGHNASLNFDNLFENANGGRDAANLKGTIEFRQHAGTLDSSEIFAWVELTCQIVKFCGGATPRKMVETCILAANTSFSLERLLSHIRCSGDLCRYYATPQPGEPDPRRATSTIPGSRPHPEIAPLLDAIEAGGRHRANRDRVAATIQEKMRTKAYGLRRGMVMNMAPATLDREFREATSRTMKEGYDPHSPFGKAHTTYLVYRELARRYDRR